MGSELTTIDHGAALVDRPGGQSAALTIGQAANTAAGAAALADYRARKSANTLLNHDAALGHFARFLAGLAQRGAAALAAGGLDGADLDDATAAWVTLDGAALGTSPAAWRGVTWGIVSAWRAALLHEGYSVGTINNRLSAVRVYARLAGAAGAIPADELTLIRAVEGYGADEGRRIDNRRPRARMDVKKSADAVVWLEPDQRERLKRAADSTGRAARDALMVGMFLDLGLRLGELAALTVEDIDLDAGRLFVYRPKVSESSFHDLRGDGFDLLPAVHRYVESRPPGAPAALWLAGDRRGRLLAAPMSARAIAARIKVLAGDVGAVGLSPHDLRHNWTERAVKAGTSDSVLMDAGGWKTRAMIDRYRRRSAIANQGIMLTR